MSKSQNKSFSLSLTQTLSAIFIAIIILVLAQSVLTARGINKVGDGFEQLSRKALPLAMNNAQLTQNVLEEVKLLNQGMQSHSSEELAAVMTSVDRLSEVAKSDIKLFEQFSETVSHEQRELLKQKISQLSAISTKLLENQSQNITMEKKLDEELPGFKYGLNSIGPEMSRVASFLALGNPESTDAANRFVANASAMERAFLSLLMQTDLKKARDNYRSIRTSISGIELAYDDFAEWHPDVKDFASLVAPYKMVREGVGSNGILQLVMSRLELMNAQKQELAAAALLADETIAILNGISGSAKKLIEEKEATVNQTISNISMLSVATTAFMVILVLGSGVFLSLWINKGLKNITRQLALLTEHNLAEQAKIIGPYEMKEIAAKLNLVIESTHESIAMVTRNCETLYKTAEISYNAAEETDKSLSEQNDALSNIASTVEQLESSIREIAQVTSESYSESQVAVDFAGQGTTVIEQNTARLESLEKTLGSNEESMSELDQNVSQISAMVDLISGIAENTNLLALNAAIEAARAGEQGRGFAVVADEVRKLAKDTSEQTANIRGMMAELVQAAERSKQSVTESREEMIAAMSFNEQVKESFNNIEQAINHIKQRVEQVSVATEEQERATANVSESLSHISEQGGQTKRQLESMIENSEQVAEIAGHQQAMLHKYKL
ncbi:methyl-accepting chemotaxis protein [Vibrio albus]|uniref:Methyl-accepting chemotaxis protein n=1 Tax=Vibrio albus TaxID=2200953 RepID=A0A2U3BD63_9VIBR|nr:methyl-accepting chemotaxis protein [Vibrio albus]PWI34713.1 methyl-accepting chemotaxis protein [Vibrio albus]